jgi:hypothetical protein
MNSNFRKVETLASPISELSTSDLLAVKAVVQKEVVAGNVIPTAKNTVATVVGYTPTEFSTAAAGSSFTLLTTPSSSQATSATQENVLKLPAGARVMSVRVTNVGTALSAGAPTFTVGTYNIASGVQQPPVQVFTAAMTRATVVAGGQVGGPLATAVGAATALGASVGVAYTTAEVTYVQLTTTFTSVVSITVNDVALTAGTVQVVITYMN